MKDDERCGMCAWAQETDNINDVECHVEPPTVFVVPTDKGIGFTSSFPRLNALRSWCRRFEKGEMVRLSRIVPAGAMPIGTGAPR